MAYMIRLFPMILALIAMYTCYRSYHLPRAIERRMHDKIPAMLAGALAGLMLISQLAWVFVIGIIDESGSMLFLTLLFSIYDSLVMLFLIFISSRR
jgi:hypothetical protein